MKKILIFILTLFVVVSCNTAQKEAPTYEAEVSYKFHYHTDRNQMEENYVLETRVDSGDIIFCIRVPKIMYDTLEIGDSVFVTTLYNKVLRENYPIIKGRKTRKNE